MPWHQEMEKPPLPFTRELLGFNQVEFYNEGCVHVISKTGTACVLSIPRAELPAAKDGVMSDMRLDASPRATYVGLLYRTNGLSFCLPRTQYTTPADIPREIVAIARRGIETSPETPRFIRAPSSFRLLALGVCSALAVRAVTMCSGVAGPLLEGVTFITALQILRAAAAFASGDITHPGYHPPQCPSRPGHHLSHAHNNTTPCIFQTPKYLTQGVCYLTSSRIAHGPFVVTSLFSCFLLSPV